jgi:aminodeoxyfutalosine synthase
MTTATVELLPEKLPEMPADLMPIAEKVSQGERITGQDAITLYESDALACVGALAEFVRRRKAGPGKQRYVYYVHNMQLNPTNYCVETCRFCTYANPEDQARAYTWTVDRVLDEVSSKAKLGINEVHMVGGLNPACDLNYYEEVFRAIKADFPQIHLKALTAVEIEYLSQLEGISFEDTLKHLLAAGLDSMPGGGAEIFDSLVRQRMAVKKTAPDVWLAIHGIAHKLGIPSTATMLTGISESVENKIDHMLQLRKQQDLSGGFLCFIPLKCYYEGTNIKSEVNEPGDEDLLKDIAVSRLLLDNFPHIKAYWVQLGEQLAQTAFSFGADDMDGTIYEEKITHEAGAHSPLKLAQQQIEQLIISAGYIPVERDTTYNIIRAAA